MKIIDLLNKIANGEEVPKKIKHNNLIFDYVDASYYNSNYGLLFDNYYVDGILNDEVEILDYGIEKIDMFDYFTGYWHKELPKDFLEHIETNFSILNDKINEIIDKLNKE